MFKFIHAADLHIDSPLLGLERYEGAPVDAIRNATREATSNLVQLAIDEQVAFVAIAGDLYDGAWQDYRTGLFFVSQMTRLREAGIPVFLIAGNHDAQNKMTKTLPLPANVRMLRHDRPQSEALEDIGVIVHGQGFARAAVLENLAAAYPPAKKGFFNLGLLHTCANGASSAHPRYAPCTIEDMTAKEYQYWALGHVHNRSVLSKEGEAPIAFSGNLQGRHAREDGAKGCFVVTVDDAMEATPRFVPLDVFRWSVAQVDATGAPDDEAVLESFVSEIQRLIAESDNLPLAVRVRVRGACKAHASLVSNPQKWIGAARAVAVDATGGQAWIEKVCLETRPAGEELQIPDGPLRELANLLDELRRGETPLAPFAKDVEELRKKLPLELLNGPDAVLPEDAEQFDARLHEMLEDVQPILAARMGGAK